MLEVVGGWGADRRGQQFTPVRRNTLADDNRIRNAAEFLATREPRNTAEGEEASAAPAAGRSVFQSLY